MIYDVNDVEKTHGNIFISNIFLSPLLISMENFKINTNLNVLEITIMMKFSSFLRLLKFNKFQMTTHKFGVELVVTVLGDDLTTCAMMMKIIVRCCSDTL